MTTPNEHSTERRTGDSIEISGDYQYNALHHGHPTQRFWHHGKYLQVEQLLDLKDDDVVLDVGCGSGILAATLAEHNPHIRVVGIDGNPSAIAFAQSTYNLPNLEFRKGLVDELNLDDLHVNKIAFLEVIEHIYFDQGLETLRQFHRILSPGGRLVVSTPNYRSMWPVIEWLLDHTNAAPTLAEEQHVAHYHPKLLAQTGRSAGFRVHDLRTLHIVAPWIASLGWKYAEALHAFEQKKPRPFGSLVLATFDRD